MILFQILFILFSLFAIGAVFARKKQKDLGPKGFFFWFLFWVVADLAVIWPESTSVVANTFGIGRGSDFVLYIAVAFIFYILFKLHIKLESIGRDITKVVRDRAIEEKNK